MAAKSSARIGRKAERFSGWCYQRLWRLRWKQLPKRLADIGDKELLRTIDTLWTRIALGLVLAPTATDGFSEQHETIQRNGSIVLDLECDGVRHPVSIAVCLVLLRCRAPECRAESR